jgi:hypothetical protein
MDALATEAKLPTSCKCLILLQFTERLARVMRGGVIHVCTVFLQMSWSTLVPLSPVGKWASLNKDFVEAGACVGPLIRSRALEDRMANIYMTRRPTADAQQALTQADARWYRRAPFLRGMMANSSLAAAVNADGRPTGNNLTERLPVAMWIWVCYHFCLTLD